MLKNMNPRLPLAVTLFSVVMAGCGGGGGGAAAPIANTPVVPASVTTYVTGVITGFGSIIINGVRYESDSATVSKEGKTATVADLKTGEVVQIRVEKDSAGVNHAKAVEQSRLAQGAVEAVDLAANTLTIAGQTILVTVDTIFDPAIAGGALAGIAVGDIIEVHGFASSTGAPQATRIEKADPADTEIEVTGKVTALDATAKRFTIGTQVVDYATATLVGLASSGPADGDLVEVKGTTLLGDGALQAVRVKKEDGGMQGQKGDSGELGGLVTNFVSVTDFAVNGQKITTDSTTVYVGGVAGDLKLDAKVEIEGQLDVAGVLVADRVIFKLESTLEIQAPVDAVDTTASTVTALGLVFTVNADTRKEDSVTGNHFFSLADVHAGDYLEVAGYPDTANAGKWIATKLELRTTRAKVSIEGLAEQLLSPDFSVGGIAVSTTLSTTFKDGNTTLTQEEFFALTGKRVDVEGTWTGAAPLVATKVKIAGARH